MRRRCFATATTAAHSLRQTPLHAWHMTHGARMVPFAGYAMPLQYAQGTLDAHHWLRRISGKKSAEYLSRLIPANLARLAPDHATYSLLMLAHGGIQDDIILTGRSGHHFHMVCNAARAKEDLDYLRSHLPTEDDSVWIRVREERSLLALQGPSSSAVLQSLIDANTMDLARIGFMTGRTAITVAGIDDCEVTRGGYTGEDGFEISVPSEKATTLADAILEDARVKPIGLGARDTLRLEAGLCLYGHDINEETTPIEASLAWTIRKPRFLSRVMQGDAFLAKERRVPGEFLGVETLLDQIQHGVRRKRVGLIVDGAPAREGAEILDAESESAVGIVTSGGPSPILQKNIAMGYVDSKKSKVGTECAVKVRGKVWPAQVVKMPFVPTKYYKP